MFSIQQLSIVKWNKNEIGRPRCQRSCFELNLTVSKCHTEMTLLKWLYCDNDIFALLSQPLTLPTAFEVSTPKSRLLRATPNSSSPPNFSDVDSSSHMDCIWRREALARSELGQRNSSLYLCCQIPLWMEGWGWPNEAVPQRLVRIETTVN